jgi:hypothetical protein
MVMVRSAKQTSAGRVSLRRGLFCFLCCFCFLATARSGPCSEAVLQSAAPSSVREDFETQQPASQGSGSEAKGRIDACALITKGEIEAVQGEPVKETKSNESPSSSFVRSQCFFLTATFPKSVSLALVLPDPGEPSALTPRDYWKKQFHPPEQTEKEKHEPAAGKAKTPKENEEEREKDLSNPRPIEGLGEEAYWVGNAITGALYVLQGDAFLRISVGGVREESARIEKSKALARAALKRLGPNSSRRHRDGAQE